MVSRRCEMTGRNEEARRGVGSKERSVGMRLCWSLLAYSNGDRKWSGAKGSLCIELRTAQLGIQITVSMATPSPVTTTMACTRSACIGRYCSGTSVCRGARRPLVGFDLPFERFITILTPKQRQLSSQPGSTRCVASFSPGGLGQGRAAWSSNDWQLRTQACLLLRKSRARRRERTIFSCLTFGSSS
jgi:hypothetical protein